MADRKNIAALIRDFRTGNKREWTALLSTLSSMFNKVVSLVAVFFYVRWTLPYLGAERFGVWMTMTTIITFISIFSDLGLGNSLVNQIAASRARKSDRELHEYTSSAFFFLFIVACVLGLFAYLGSDALLGVITNGLHSKADIEEASIGLTFLFCAFLINLPFVTVDKTLEGLQLTYVSSLWATAGNVVSLVATFVVTQYSLGLVWLIGSTLGVQCFFRILYFFIEFNTRLRVARPVFGRIDAHKTSRLLQSGLLFFLLNVFNVLAFQTDNLIISKALGIESVPLFSLMQKLMTVAMFFWLYTIALWPAFADAHSKQDKKWIRKTALFVLKFNTLVGIAFGLGLVLLAGPILELWTGAPASPSFAMRMGFACYILLNGMIGAAALVFNTGPLLKKHVLGFCIASVSTVVLKMIFIRQLGVDYLMYMCIGPYVVFYLIPCYVKFKRYLAEPSSERKANVYPPNQNELIPDHEKAVT